jgi:hypothetical protein
MKTSLILAATYLIASVGADSGRAALRQGTIIPATDKPESVQAAIPSTGPVSANGGELYLGGERLAPPYVLEFIGDALVVNGHKLRRLPDRPRGRVTISHQDSLQYHLIHQLSLQAAQEIQKAYAAGLPDQAVRERLAQFYSASDLVESVHVDSIRLDVTYRHRPGLPERIMLPPRESRLTQGQRLARYQELKRRELESLKRMLEDGALVLILPTGPVSLPRQQAVQAREAIERYKLRGDSAGLSQFVPAEFWGYLREPVGMDPAR